jgi:hypothetical protein
MGIDWFFFSIPYFDPSLILPNLDYLIVLTNEFQASGKAKYPVSGAVDERMDV